MFEGGDGMKKIDSPANQSEFDFHRGDQLGFLRSVQIADGDSVSGTACKAVLRAIDDFGRECFASIPTVAASANVSERVCKRAISRLVKLSLVTRERQRNTFGTVTNHYRIVWSEVECLSRVGRPPVGDRRTFQGLETNGPSCKTIGPLATDHRAMVADQWATSDRPSGHGGLQSERSEKDPPLSAIGPAAAVSIFWSDGERRSALELLSKFVERPRQTLETAINVGISPSELGSIVAEFQANRPLFRSAGAIVDRIRSGSWPVSGVKSIEELAKASEKVAKSKRSFDRDDLRYRIAKEWKAIGKWEFATTDEIEEEIEKRIAV
jgi:hypothetical protein